jgi:prepilin-type N-terminal cleavage/methylation domain-containing protein
MLLRLNRNEKCGPSTSRRNKEAGFSLIELLIVVAIILIIAAIAIPNYLNARMAANEASAVQSIRTIQSGLSAYISTYPAVGFPAQLVHLGPGAAVPCISSSTQACLIDSVLANGTKAGYVLTYVQDASSTPSIGYTLNADPTLRGSTGHRSFYSDQPGVIRFNSAAAAAITDPAI